MPTTLFVSLRRYLTLVRRDAQAKRPFWEPEPADITDRRTATARRHQSLGNHYLPRVRGALPTSRTSRQMEIA